MLIIRLTYCSKLNIINMWLGIVQLEIKCYPYVGSSEILYSATKQLNQSSILWRAPVLIRNHYLDFFFSCFSPNYFELRISTQPWRLQKVSSLTTSLKLAKALPRPHLNGAGNAVHSWRFMESDLADWSSVWFLWMRNPVVCLWCPDAQKYFMFSYQGWRRISWKVNV